MEIINPNEYLSGQSVAESRIVRILERFAHDSEAKANNPSPGDEVFTTSFYRGENMFYTLALAKINSLVEELKSCAKELEQNEVFE